MMANYWQWEKGCSLLKYLEKRLPVRRPGVERQELVEVVKTVVAEQEIEVDGDEWRNTWRAIRARCARACSLQLECRGL